MRSDSPLHAEHQHSAHGRSSQSNEQTSFKTSTFRLQKASEMQKAAVSGGQPYLVDQASTSGAEVSPRIAATSFSLLNDSSVGALPSTAKQPGLDFLGTSPPRKGRDTEFTFDISSLSGRQDEPGVVPFIAVGSVFALIRQRYVPCRCFTRARQNAGL